MKSIGSSSKMLREAIGERISDKKNTAKHKFMKEYQHTKNVMGSWTNDTKTNTSMKLKNVRSKIDNFSLKRNKHKRNISANEEERPQTTSFGTNEMLQSLSFNSPLNNRSYNLENIPSQVSTYEIPKTLNRRSSDDLPSYIDVGSDKNFLKRNTNLTQSLYSTVKKHNNIDKAEKSEDPLYTISSGSSDDNESEPPRIPPPELHEKDDEEVYGKIKKLPSNDYENSPIVPLRKPPPPPIKQQTSKVFNEITALSTTANISESLLDRNLNDISPKKPLNSYAVYQSESWKYVDNVTNYTAGSGDSNDLINTYDENERSGASDLSYGRMIEDNSNLLTPQRIPINEDTDRKSVSMTREILNEFDPLSRESFDAFIMTKMNHLSLLETLLSEETYGTIDEEHYTVPDEEQIGENSSVESINAPTPPDRDDSLINVETEVVPSKLAPKPPSRVKKSVTRTGSVIIHQNLNLKDSAEDLAQPFLAHLEPEPSTSAIVDLSRPKPQQSNWFVESESKKFVKNNLDNPNNSHLSQIDKLTKSVPQLTKVNNLSANRDQYLPTYEESKKDEIVKMGSVEKAPDVVKTRSSLFTFGLKRRSSLKETTKLEAKDFISRPPFCEDLHHVGDKSVILFKLPTGVIEDILKELNARFVELKNRQFKAFSDSEFKVLKEHLDFTHLSSIQHLVNHKFAEFKTDSGRQIYCFEINLAIPKTSSSNAGAVNALLDIKGNPVKTQRASYVYGIHSKTEK